VKEKEKIKQRYHKKFQQKHKQKENVSDTKLIIKRYYKFKKTDNKINSTKQVKEHMIQNITSW